METNATYEVNRLGVFAPEMVDRDVLYAGEVGYLICGIKLLADAKVGDTVTHKDQPADEPLPGFADIKPMVYSGIYPIDSKDFENHAMLWKNYNSMTVPLTLNQKLPMHWVLVFDVVISVFYTWKLYKRRLEREFDLNLLNTSPSVIYQVVKTSGEEIQIHSPSKLPKPQDIRTISEPIAKVTIHCPQKITLDQY